MLLVIGLMLLPFALLYLLACWLDSRSYAAVARKWGWTVKQNEYGFYKPEAPARPDSLAALFARITDRRLLPACQLSAADIRQLAAQYHAGDSQVLAFISNDAHNRVAEIGLVLSDKGIHWLDQNGKPLMLPWKYFPFRSGEVVLEDGEIKFTGATKLSTIPVPYYGDFIRDFLFSMAKLMKRENALEPVKSLFTPSTSMASAFGQRINGWPMKRPLQESLIEFLQGPPGLVVAFLIGFLLMWVLRQFGV